ncbi:MAG: ethanolamine utilization protein EutJ [Anaerolineaceae bacterium]
MTQLPRILTALTLEDYLDQAGAVILHRSQSETAPSLPEPPQDKLRVGVDLGTAYLVLVVLDEDGVPIAGEWQFAQVVRDGLVVDYIGATDLLKAMKERVERRIGRELTHAASGYPPGVPLAEVRATANVIQAAGMDCQEMIDEPSAANNILRIHNGAIVDVGGGTTGVAVIKDGQVIYTADEATGGTHFSLVIAGSLGISFEEAEELKIKTTEQDRLYPVVRPVMEKVGNIVSRHIRPYPVDNITLVGGTTAFKGMANVIQEYTGIHTSVPSKPVFITPLGMAMQDMADN